MLKSHPHAEEISQPLINGGLVDETQLQRFQAVLQHAGSMFGKVQGCRHAPTQTVSNSALPGPQSSCSRCPYQH